MCLDGRPQDLVFVLVDRPAQPDLADETGLDPRVAETLLKVGIEADVFGTDTVRLSSLPPEIEADDAREMVVDLLDRATALDGVPERVAGEVEEERKNIDSQAEWPSTTLWQG